jgi:hypothetical protein
MSGGKACGKQAAQYAGKQADEGSVETSRDTTALLAELQALHHTHKEATRLFLMAASQGGHRRAVGGNTGLEIQSTLYDCSLHMFWRRELH